MNFNKNQIPSSFDHWAPRSKRPENTFCFPFFVLTSRMTSFGLKYGLDPFYSYFGCRGGMIRQWFIIGKIRMAQWEFIIWNLLYSQIRNKKDPPRMYRYMSHIINYENVQNRKISSLRPIPLDSKELDRKKTLENQKILSLSWTRSDILKDNCLVTLSWNMDFLGAYLLCIASKMLFFEYKIRKMSKNRKL